MTSSGQLQPVWALAKAPAIYLKVYCLFLASDSAGTGLAWLVSKCCSKAYVAEG